jgi:predicted MPP superfamily phosphohydrolase
MSRVNAGGKALTTAAGLVAGAGLAAFAWGSLVERKRFTLRQVRVPVLAPGSASLRVLHLSDLHMAPWQRDKQEWVRSLATLKPDLVVDTGDNLGHEDGVSGIEYALEPFAGIPGVFVNGSNDYFGPQLKNPLRYFGGPSLLHTRPKRLDIDALHGVFERLGWKDLDNAADLMEIGGTRLEFFGVDDPHIGLDRLDLIAGAVDEMRASDPLAEETWPDPAEPAAARATLTVGVTHAPYQRVLNSFVNHGAQLILAGHTHGGQVCVPKFGALVTNCDIPRRQVRGLSLWNQGLRTAFLNVSAGLGTSIYAPVRFACPPEATLLTLTAVDA